MNAFTKKTVFATAGIAAAAALAIGAAGPALASTSHDSTSNSMTSLWSAARLSSLNNALDNIANGATVGSVSHGNVSNESPVVVAPKVGDVLSGNAVASGNETSTGNGNSSSSSASDLVDTTGIIDGVTRSVDLGSIVGR